MPPTEPTATVSDRLHRLAAVVSDLMDASSREEVALVVTERLPQAADAGISSISVLRDPETLELIGIRGVREGVAESWATYPVSGPTPAAESVRTGEMVHAVGLAEITRRFPTLEMAVEGERTLLCLPLKIAGRCVGVLSLSFAGLRELDEAESLLLGMLADICATTLGRIDARSDADDRAAKLAFLAHATAQLTQDLDYEATLAAVAEAAVPWFADWCAIALSDDGVLRNLSVAHNKPELEDTVRELMERYPAQPTDPGGSYEVLRTGVSSLIPDVTDEMLVGSAKDDEHLRLIRTLELRSGMSCPLKVRDHVLGVITWVAGEGGRRFSEADLEFGEEIARRAAVAIDNAQLHSQVRDVALELQRAVLPESLPDVPGWTAAVRYLPAGRTDAGGDFFDVVPLEDEQLGVFVGDVMGRGVLATSVMAQMRSAIRTLMAIDPQPAAVVAGLDRVFHTFHVEQLVTMVYALADPGLDHVAIINAGHPEPIVLRADGSTEIISHPSTLLLGAGGGRRSVVDVDLWVGDCLLLYTDGLTERRGEHGDVGRDRLEQALSELRSDDVETWLTRVVEEVRDTTRDDDVAALMLLRDG